MQIKRKSENCLFILVDKRKTKQKINIRRYKKQKNKIVAVTFSPRSDRTAAFLNKKLCLLLIQIFYRDPSLMNLTMISCGFQICFRINYRWLPWRNIDDLSWANNTRALPDCPTFWESEIGIFFNYQRIARVRKARVVSGRGKGCRCMLPQKVLKSWCSATPFLVWEKNFCLKCSIKQLSFSWLYIYVSSSTRAAGSGRPIFRYFFWISVVGILCSWVSIIRIHTKYQSRCQNRDFFLWLIAFWSGWDFKKNRGNPAEIGKIMQSSYQTRHCGIPAHFREMPCTTQLA